MESFIEYYWSGKLNIYFIKLPQIIKDCKNSNQIDPLGNDVAYLKKKIAANPTNLGVVPLKLNKV